MTTKTNKDTFKCVKCNGTNTFLFLADNDSIHLACRVCNTVNEANVIKVVVDL